MLFVSSSFWKGTVEVILRAFFDVSVNGSEAASIAYETPGKRASSTIRLLSF